MFMKKKLFFVMALLSMSLLSFGEIIVNEKKPGNFGMIAILVFIALVIFVIGYLFNNLSTIVVKLKNMFDIDVQPNLPDGFYEE